MTNRHLLLGPPGCGKTHTLIEMVKSRLESGIPADRIAYVSFTRKAVEEARQRAAVSLGLSPADLPYFRTLHSLSYLLLGLSRSQIMGREDWALLSEKMGVEVFDEATEDGPPLAEFSMHTNRYLSLLHRSRMRLVPLEQEFAERADPKLQWGMQVLLQKSLDAYLRESGKFTFVSLLEAAAQRAWVPSLDLLIVDEAQDLVPLQWSLVNRLAAGAREVWFAGDDDQAIHRWAGVDVARFHDSAPVSRVLEQSYRLPKAVFNVSRQIIRHVHDRLPKTFRPTAEQGYVGYCGALRQLDLGSGSWTLMTRTRGLARWWADELRSQGQYLSLFGKTTVDPDKLAGMALWERLQAGPLGLSDVRRLYKALPRQGPLRAVLRGSDKLLDMLPPDGEVGYEELVRDCGLKIPLSTPSEVAVGLSEEDRVYVRSIRRQGESLDKPPRIKVTTMHAMKGGEDDNVVVYLGTSRLCAMSPYQDDEYRTFYVGATRARSRLFLVASEHRHRFLF